MFWILSLLIPSLRRQSSGEPFNDLAVMIRSPQSRGLLFQILGVIGGSLLIWVMIAAILSVFNAWVIVLMTFVLGVAVGYREWQRHRREGWIVRGYCAQCGYDLRATPERCPECGRDARLDEPIWRRMRRELEAKLLASVDSTSQSGLTPVQRPARDNASVPPSRVAPLPVLPLPLPGAKLLARTPDFIQGPIPLEGNEEPGAAEKPESGFTE